MTVTIEGLQKSLSADVNETFRVFLAVVNDMAENHRDGEGVAWLPATCKPPAERVYVERVCTTCRRRNVGVLVPRTVAPRFLSKKTCSQCFIEKKRLRSKLSERKKRRLLKRAGKQSGTQKRRRAVPLRGGPRAYVEKYKQQKHADSVDISRSEWIKAWRLHRDKQTVV